MDNAEKAMMMAFSVIVLGFALALAMYMFSEITVTSEELTFYSDSTIYYDNVELDKSVINPDSDINEGTVRIVSAETIIPTLYRYYKENFCVKIYGAKSNPADPNSERELLQIFDVNLEGKVHGAAGDTLASAGTENPTHIRNYAYNQAYNRHDPSIEVYKPGNTITIPYFMFGAPWLGSTESVKSRIDYFVNGKAGYINNTYVDYTQNPFYTYRTNNDQFKERFINYSYSGQTMITEDGDELVTGEKSKDKIVIIYTLID